MQRIQWESQMWVDENPQNDEFRKISVWFGVGHQTEFSCQYPLVTIFFLGFILYSSMTEICAVTYMESPVVLSHLIWFYSPSVTWVGDKLQQWKLYLVDQPADSEQVSFVSAYVIYMDALDADIAIESGLFWTSCPEKSVRQAKGFNILHVFDNSLFSFGTYEVHVTLMDLWSESWICETNSS